MPIHFDLKTEKARDERGRFISNKRAVHSSSYRREREVFFKNKEKEIESVLSRFTREIDEAIFGKKAFIKPVSEVGEIELPKPIKDFWDIEAVSEEEFFGDEWETRGDFEDELMEEVKGDYERGKRK